MAALEGKTAIVTGASSALKLDVADPESCRRFVDAAVVALGGIDILFDNAGLNLGRGPV